MYMKPTLPGAGGLCAMRAWMNSMEFLSMHMGSGPGVLGASGMQVNPLLPLRTVRMVPSELMTTMVAPWLTLAGAAAVALAMISLSVDAGLAVDCGSAARA